MEYRLAFIFEKKVVNGKQKMPSQTYKIAYDNAIAEMRSDKNVLATLIYSKTTAIVIKRKHIFRNQSYLQDIT